MRRSWVGTTRGGVCDEWAGRGVCARPFAEKLAAICTRSAYFACALFIDFIDRRVHAPCLLPNTADLVEAMRRLEIKMEVGQRAMERKVDALASVIESDSPSAAT